MKSGARWAALGLLVAVPVAAASAGYLYFAKKEVERVVVPVELHTPDLFPADTLLYTEVHGLDASFAEIEGWWKRFETTATSHFLHQMWEKDRRQFPPELVENLNKIETQLAQAEAKFGYRPTARDFFATYGKHLSFGLLPGPAGQRPPVLLVVRLPEGGTSAMLQGRLEKATGVKPAEPKMQKGFPMFQEEAPAGVGTITYGVGRGYLVISDSLAQVQAALDRLATATDGKDPKRPTGVLSDDAILRRVDPKPGESSSMILYARRAQKFGQWEKELAIIDEYFHNAFVLAPKDDAVAFAFDGKGGGVNCSFSSGTGKPLMAALPAGLFQVDAILPAPGMAAWQKAAMKEWLAKPFWKECEAFFKDPANLKKLLEEALPPHDRPPDDLVGRIPNDVKLVGDGMQAMCESLSGGELPTFVVAAKSYTRKDGRVVPEYVYGLDINPFAIFTIAGGLDLAKTKFPEWVTREEKPGVLIWQANMDRVRELIKSEVPRDAMEFWGDTLETYNPAVVITGNRLLVVTGKELLDEIVGLATGGTVTAFEKDPIYVEALGQLKPGFYTISYKRPVDFLTAAVSPYRGIADVMLAKQEMRDEKNIADAVNAGLKTLDRMIRWSSRLRCEVTVGYPDSQRPAETLVLVDPKEEAKGPSFGADDGPLRVAGFLPAGTWALAMQRLELKQGVDAVRKAFLEELPGGEKRFHELTASAPPEAKAAIEDMLNRFLCNLKGEFGGAVSLPIVEGKAPPAPDPDVLLARAPAFILFVQCERPGDALGGIKMLLDNLHAEMNPEPFEKRLADAKEQGYSWPMGTRLVTAKLGDGTILAMDFLFPMEEQQRYIVVSFCVVQRGDFIFITNSVPVMKHLASGPEGGPESLAHALSTQLPTGAVPAKLSSAVLLKTDAIGQQVRLFLDIILPQLPGLSLRGYPGRPPQDRIQAHQQGWTRFVDLAQDLFATGTWKVDCTTRTGDVIRRVDKRVPEKRN